jgi:DNA-binding transcriptional regulator GbsR (MarR family)
MNQEIKPEDYLGIEFSKFQSRMRQLALSSPKEYFELQSKVSETAKDQAVKSMYKTIFELLRNGKSYDPATGATDDIDAKLGKIGMSTQIVNQLALNISSTLNDFIDEEIIEKILPTSYTKIAELKTSLQAQK